MGSCYLEVSFGTTGVDTWCYLECYLVLPGMFPGVTWALPDVTLVFILESFFLLWSQNIRVSQTQTFDKDQFPPRGVTWAHACSRYLFTWPTLWSSRVRKQQPSTHLIRAVAVNWSHLTAAARIKCVDGWKKLTVKQ